MNTISEILRGPIKHPQQLMTQQVEAADAIDELVATLERSIWYLEDEGCTDEFTVLLDLKAILAKHK